MALRWSVVAPHPPILIPEIGGNMLREVQDTLNSLETISKEVGKKQVDTIVVVTPHGPYSQDGVVIWNEPIMSGSLQQFGGSPSLSFSTDQNYVFELTNQMTDSDVAYRMINEGMIGSGRESLDHGAYVPLYYISNYLTKDTNIVVVIPSGGNRANLWRLGELIITTGENLGKDIGLLISGDLSHRLSRGAPGGYHPEAYKFDEKIKDILSSGQLQELNDIKKEELQLAGECGYHPLLLSAGAIYNVTDDPQPELLSYEAPFGVGYLVAELFCN